MTFNQPDGLLDMRRGGVRSRRLVEVEFIGIWRRGVRVIVVDGMINLNVFAKGEHRWVRIGS